MIELRECEKLYGRRAFAGGKARGKDRDRERQGKGLFATSLTIPDGQVVGLLGENGAGKSTLLRAAAGLVRLGGGAVLFDGEPPQKAYGRIAYITGEGSYFPSMTAGDYEEFLARFFPSFDTRRYEKLLEFFEIDPLQRIQKMSTGERAKVEVAAGVSKRAKYLLMDEPFLGKDLFTRRDFLKLLAGSLRGGETILLATHYIGEVEPFLDRAILLHKGRVAADLELDALHEAGGSLTEALQTATGYDPHRYQELFADEM